MAGEGNNTGNDATNRIEALLEQLNSRFELVVEVADGFNGRLLQLREEMLSQFSEVGRQIRFLSDRIGDSRAGLEAMHAEFTSEMVRINEAVGAARLQLKQDLAGIEGLREAVAALGAADSSAALGRQVQDMRAELRGEVEKQFDRLRQEIGARSGDSSHGPVQAAPERRRALAVGAEAGSGELQAEVKNVNKTLANLVKKFERFDDRITVAVKDQDQRLRKLERHARG